MTQKPDDSASEQGLQAISQIIFGEPASKANSRKVVRIGGMSRLIKSSKALKYSDMFKQQCRQLETLMTGDLRVTMWIYYASRRPDLDESLILDLMQGLIYENDRQVKEKHIYWGLDPEKPRTEIIVECIPSVSPKKSPARGGARRERQLQKQYRLENLRLQYKSSPCKLTYIFTCCCTFKRVAKVLPERQVRRVRLVQPDTQDTQV